MCAWISSFPFRLSLFAHLILCYSNCYYLFFLPVFFFFIRLFDILVFGPCKRNVGIKIVFLLSLTSIVRSFLFVIFFFCLSSTHLKSSAPKRFINEKWMFFLHSVWLMRWGLWYTMTTTITYAFHRKKNLATQNYHSFDEWKWRMEECEIRVLFLQHRNWLFRSGMVELDPLSTSSTKRETAWKFWNFVSSLNLNT